MSVSVVRNGGDEYDSWILRKSAWVALLVSTPSWPNNTSV